jgi:hypothetical protein
MSFFFVELLPVSVAEANEFFSHMEKILSLVQILPILSFGYSGGCVKDNKERDLSKGQ